jgi:hypothetical protein
MPTPLGTRVCSSYMCYVVANSLHTVTVTVTGNLLNTKVLTLVSRLLSQPVQSPSDMRYRPKNAETPYYQIA